MTRSRRRRLATTLTVLVLVLVGGVLGVRAATGPAPVRKASGPVAGGTLRLLSPERYPALDPAALVSPRQRAVGRLLFRTLLAYSADGRSLEPDLATGPGEPSAGGRVWTYHLTSARYADGTAVVAGDVVRGVRRALVRGALPQGWLAAASAPDATTVVVRFLRPFADADSFLALTGAAPVPAAGVAASGPYRVESSSTSAFRLVRNAHWEGTPAGPDAVEAELGLSGAAIDQRILAGEGGDAYAVTDKPVPDVAPPAHVRQVSGPDGSVLFTALNLRRGPFVDLKVRQALEVAFPVAGVLSKGTVLGSDLLPEDFPGHDDLDLYGRKDRDFSGDAARAKRMLRAAGYAQPVPVTAAIPASTASTAEVLRSALGSAGFDVRVTVVPDARYYTVVGNAARQPDLVSYAWSPDWPTASAILPQLFTCATLTSTANHNVAQHCDRGFDQQVALALAELDAEARAGMWAALDRRLVEEAVVVPRAFGVSTALVGAQVRDARAVLCYGGAVDLVRVTLR